MTRKFTLIKNDRAIEVDPERIPPGRLVAHSKGADYETNVFRVGERYYKRVAYFNLRWLVNHIRECSEYQLQSKEMFHLYYLADRDFPDLRQA